MMFGFRERFEEDQGQMHVGGKAAAPRLGCGECLQELCRHALYPQDTRSKQNFLLFIFCRFCLFDIDRDAEQDNCE